MAFVVLPAVDVAGGVVVRTGSDVALNPLDSALALQADGAEWLHLVDMDAAFGRGSNADILGAVVRGVDVPVEVSGGIREDASLEWALSTGCSRVVLAAEALADRAWCEQQIRDLGDRIAVALDVRVDPAGTRPHRLAPRGRGSDVGDLWSALTWLDAAGCHRVIVTDVSRDGSLDGPNLDLLTEVCSATTSRVVASGGIATLDDLVRLARSTTAGERLEGAIVGTALHTGRFTLTEALGAVRDAGS